MQCPAGAQRCVCRRCGRRGWRKRRSRRKRLPRSWRKQRRGAGRRRRPGGRERCSRCVLEPAPPPAPAAVSRNPAAVPTQTEGESAQLRGFVLRSPCRVVLLAVSPGCHPRFLCGPGQILTKDLNLWIGTHENLSVKPLSEVQSAVAVGPSVYAVGSAEAAGAVTHRLERWGHQCFPAER